VRQGFLGEEGPMNLAGCIDLTEDEVAVSRAAAMLQISEFHLFQIAYTSWFGLEVSEKKIEPFFVEYMFESIAPPWVRHFVRKVFCLDKEGKLRPEDFNIRRRALNPADKAEGLGYIVIISLITLFFCFMLVTSPFQY
jgi:hypothetical protein